MFSMRQGPSDTLITITTGCGCIPPLPSRSCAHRRWFPPEGEINRRWVIFYNGQLHGRKVKVLTKEGGGFTATFYCEWTRLGKI